MMAVARRNILIFFRDRASVFFSMLSVLIIFLLYFLFLGNMMEGNMPQGAPGGGAFMASWIMGGTLAVATITTTMGATGQMVEDKAKKITRDLSASPLSRSALAGGYIISTIVIGLIMGLFTLVCAEIYIVLKGGALLTLLPMLKVLGILVLSVLAGSSMMFFVISFFKSLNAYSTASALIGTLIGFLTGVYMPVGILPEPVQWVVKLFPVSHAGLLFRSVLMEEPMQQSFATMPANPVYADGKAFDFAAFEKTLGLKFDYAGHVAPLWVSVAVLVATAALFFALSVHNVRRKAR